MVLDTHEALESSGFHSLLLLEFAVSRTDKTLFSLSTHFCFSFHRLVCHSMAVENSCPQPVPLLPSELVPIILYCPHYIVLAAQAGNSNLAEYLTNGVMSA